MVAVVVAVVVAVGVVVVVVVAVVVGDIKVMYKIAERFKSIQGEGVYAGTPMAFIRFVGCSVGKKICQHCDTDFEKVGSSWRCGGEFTAEQLRLWSEPYRHVCLTGGEPLDQNLSPLLEEFYGLPRYSMPMLHVETSGTKHLGSSEALANVSDRNRQRLWVCVSPKPGFIEDVVLVADEIKVIVPGLGTDESLPHLGAHYLYPRDTFRWPTLEDALRWAAAGKTVFLQPRNGKYDVDHVNLRYVQDVIAEHPELRLSVQMHKVLKVQ